MKLNTPKIRRLMQEKKIAQLSMCVQIDVTPAFFGCIMHSGDVPEDIAVPIAEVLGVELEEIRQ